jgi:hypothetical protein
MDDFAAFTRLLEALRPWLGHVVIIGGWAHRLHRFHPLAHPPTYAPIQTRDADVAFSLSAPLVGDIANALQEAGFRKDLSGEHMPPITQYRLGDDDQGFFAEFLTPLQGSGYKRNGEPDVTAAKAGVTAQKLRYLELLLVCPWVVRLTKDLGIPLTTPVDVMLANPACFIAQKLLIQKYRRPDKRAQDALYIHDTLDLFGSELPTLKCLWRHDVAPGLHPSERKAIEQARKDHFGVVTDVIRTAALIPQDRVLTPDRMQAACALGLDEVFG